VTGHEKLSIPEFAQREGGADLVIAAGVFYHLINPLKFVQDLRLLLRPKGRLYMTTFCLPKEKEPVMRLQYGWKGDDTNYWLASVPCVIEMAKVAQLNVIDHFQALAGTKDHPEPLMMFVAQRQD
jgi:hypothetical protein